MVASPGLIALVIAAAAGNAPLAAKLDMSKTASAVWQLATGPTTFRRKEREVTNWRLEATSSLVASLSFNIFVLSGQTPPNLPRCIKLNNYWCIKRAGWAGEIASDEEGHVGFASASEGAQTAALLLRRYYVDFGRHSAYAIVSRWAPANCGGPVASYVVRRRVARTGGGTKVVMGPRTDPGLVRGSLGGTLRARFLAAHGGRRAAGPTAVRSAPRSVVPDYSLVLMRAPTIEAGVSEAPATTGGSSLAGASLAGLAVDIPAPKASAKGSPKSDTKVAAAPVFSCSAEIQRINNYANRASAGITTNINEDLNLFTADGSPLPNLEKIMTNMASVEIGPWKADRALIVAAIAKANETRLAVLAAKRAAANAAAATR